MSSIPLLTSGEKGLSQARVVCDPTQATFPAPNDATRGLLRLLMRPLPLAELRPAAIAAGMSVEVIETAISVATRRGELRIVADRDGLPIAIGGRRG
jgi:hypothetical protein